VIGPRKTSVRRGTVVTIGHVVTIGLMVALAACSGAGEASGPGSGLSEDPGPATSAAPSTSTATSVVADASTTVTQPPSTAPHPSAPPASTTVPQPLPPAATGSLVGKTVVLDPGHNEGNASHPTEINQLVDVITQRKACDTTGTATNGGYSEARFTTDIAARVGARLRGRGATVILTRDAGTPWGPCITERAAIGNRAHAQIALSIHADGGPSGGRGFHVIRPGLVAGHNDAIISPSAAFATVLHDTFAGETGIPPATYIGTNGYDTRTDLGGLNLSTVPKVFIECANMRDATDAALLESDSGRARIAQAIADAITHYLVG
jgi:N-acetylmuramoyl-L-alanine amidase